MLCDEDNFETNRHTSWNSVQNINVALVHIRQGALSNLATVYNKLVT